MISFAKLFNIRPRELRPFSLLFSHAFFNGLAIALSFTTINIMVLNIHGIDSLPILYIITSVLLVVGGYVYTKLEHKYRANQLFLFSIFACIVWSFSFRMLLSIEHSIFFIGLAYCTYYLILTLTNLDLWGAAALIFDVRQSKRLFGPISFGESIGYIIGYSLTPLLISWLSLHDVLIFAGISFILSILMLQLLSKLYLEDLSRVDHDLHHKKHHHKVVNATQHKNKYFNKLSVIIFFSTFVYVMITFGFLLRVEKDITDLKDIAFYVGVILSIAKILNLIIKMFLSGRLLSRIGIKYSIIILPIILCITSVVGLSGIRFGNYSYFILLFSLIYIFDKTLRSSLYKPSYLVMFQPLSPHHRLEGHTLTKGYFEPLGMGSAGLCLFVLHSQGWLEINIIILLILIGSALWLFFCWQSMPDYLIQLGYSLKSQLYGQKRYVMTKEEIKHLKESKLYNASPDERLYAYSILSDTLNREESQLIIADLLQVKGDIVILETLKLIEKEKHQVPQVLIHDLLHHNNHDVRIQAAYSYTSIYGTDAIDTIMDHAQNPPAKNQEMVGALLKYAGLQGTLRVGRDILLLSNSKLASDRLMASHIVGRVHHQDLDPIINKLIYDDDLSIRKDVMLNCQRPIHHDILKRIINHDDARLSNYIKGIIEKNQTAALEIILNQFDSSNLDKKLDHIGYLSKINNRKSYTFLSKLLNTNSFKISMATIRALGKLRHFNDESVDQVISEALEQKLKLCKNLILIFNNTPEHYRTHSAIKNELQEILLRDIINLLGLIYPKNNMKKIKHNIYQSNKIYQSNAVELLENTLPNSQSKHIVPIVEQIINLEIAQGSKKIKTHTPLSDLSTMIRDLNAPVSDWLMAVMVRDATITGHKLSEKEVAFLQSRKSSYISEELEYYNNF